MIVVDIWRRLTSKPVGPRISQRGGPRRVDHAARPSSRSAASLPSGPRLSDHLTLGAGSNSNTTQRPDGPSRAPHAGAGEAGPQMSRFAQREAGSIPICDQGLPPAVSS
jgi:hypothetical protein